MYQSNLYLPVILVFYCLTSCSKSSFQNSEKQAIANAEEATASDITLEVNSSKKDIHIKEGENIEVTWDGALSEECSLHIGEEDISKERSGDIVYQNIIQDKDIYLHCDDIEKSLQVIIKKAEDKQTKLFFNGYNTRQIDGEKIKDPVTMHFVIDITNSMNDVLDVIVSQIGDFSKKLEKEDIDVHLNLTAFRDTVEPSRSFENDIESFRSALRSYTAQGGGDIPEASLKALEEASKYIEDNEDRENAIRTIVLVTDSWGHDTLNFDYDCNISATADFMKDFFSQKPNQWKFFYSSRNKKNIDLDENLAAALDPSLLDCIDNWISPSHQYEALLQALSPQASSDDHQLPWPFTKKSLLDQLYTNISETVANKKMSCMTSEIEVRKLNNIIKTWSPDIKDVWKERRENITINIKETGDKDDFQIFAKHCCLPTQDAKSGDFQSCKEDKKFQKIKIEKASVL
ncbi:MAG: VWA domain-containing protein [Oligoflexales bacterium]